MAKKIVILATQRSGSTLVCEDLRNNGLGLAEEHFGPFGLRNKDVDPGQMLKAVHKRGTDENGYFSVKIMASYASRINAILGGDANGPLWHALAETFSDAVWVQVVRRSTVRQALSRIYSRYTGINHALSQEGGKLKPGRAIVGELNLSDDISVSKAEIDRDCLDIVVENELIEMFFSDNGIVPIKLVYEEFSSNLEYIHEIMNALDIPREGRVINDNRFLRKLSGSRSDALYRDYILDRGRKLSAERALGSSRDSTSAALQGDGSRSAASLPRPRGVLTPDEARARWGNTTYYEAAERVARVQWDDIVQPFLQDASIDYSSTLELACGRGRMSNFLIERSEKFVGVDIVEKNVLSCQERFAGQSGVSFRLNDGKSLDGIEKDSISFGFCFDSMVHFDVDIVRAYLEEFQRVLRPGGYAFLHHSNFTRNPTGDFQKAPHARNFMSKELFQFLSHRAGLRVVRSQVIDWGTGERKQKDHDCLSLVQNPG